MKILESRFQKDQEILQPFFTTKPTGEGKGLGLSMAYDIITNLYGREILVENEEGKNTALVIKIPVLF